jgi:hypothetical protein
MMQEHQQKEVTENEIDNFVSNLNFKKFSNLECENENIRFLNLNFIEEFEKLSIGETYYIEKVFHTISLNPATKKTPCILKEIIKSKVIPIIYLLKFYNLEENIEQEIILDHEFKKSGWRVWKIK